MNITLYSFLALVSLYFLAYFCNLVLKIKSDRFYDPFHFAGGFLVFLLINSFLKMRLLSLVGVIIAGTAWEIYEWLIWRFISKKKSEKPQKKDTTNDLFLDFFGGLSAFASTELVQIILKLLPS